MKKLLILTVLGISLIFAGSVQAGIATPPDSLLYLIEQQESIQASDKLFDQFQYTPNNSFVDLASIIVTPVDGGLDPGPGLHFEVINDALLAQDGSSVHLSFSFRVSTLGDLLIKDNLLYYFAWATIAGGSNGSYIDEYIHDTAGNLLGTKHVEWSYDGVETTDINYASADFYPINEIFVTKDIYVWTTDVGQRAWIETFDQRFSQTAPVPEPATMFLLGTGLVGVAGAARRKKKNQD